MIRFDSDYLEGCLPEILEAFQKTNFEQTPGYSRDVYCDEARDIIREACQAPEADVHFLVGGTQTNATVISSLLRPFQGVICADTGHINVHETGAIEHGGHRTLALPGENGKISAAQVREALDAHFSDPSAEHTVQPAMVYLSFPTELGTIYTKEEMRAISKVCRVAGIPLFVDGARLGYGLASPGCDLTLPEIAALADVFYIGGTKQGALFGECVVFRNSTLSKDFRYCIKQNGGLLAKGRLLGLQYLTLFRDGLYFRASKHAVDMAQLLKASLKEKGYSFLVDSPSNQQFPILKNDDIARLHELFGFEDWAKVDDNHTAVRFCTSWATTREAVEALLSAL